MNTKYSLALGRVWNAFTILAILASVAFAAAQPQTAARAAVSVNFGAPTAYTGSASTYTVVVADFNNDGRKDFASAQWTTPNGAINVRLGNAAPAGTFGVLTSYGTGGNRTWGLATADFNLDGRLDLVATNEQSNAAAVLLSTAPGVFGAPVPISTGNSSAPYSVLARDFDADGKPDFVTANGADMGFHKGLGNGSFNAKVAYASGGSDLINIASADFNGDNRPDVAVSNRNGNNGNAAGTIGVMLNNGVGGFGSAAIYASGGNGLMFVATGDFNNDGRVDLVGANSTSSTLKVLPGNGNGTFNAALGTFAAGGTNPQSIAVGDYDVDGKADLAVVFGASSTVAIHRGVGNGTFLAPVTFNTGTSDSRSVFTTQLNADNMPDLVIGNFGANGFSVLMNVGDVTAPSISGSRTPLGNGFGWNNTNVTANFSCTDAGSGVASVTPATTLTGEGAGQSVLGTCTDIAGLSSSTTVSGISIDKTAPTLSGLPTTSPVFGSWYSGDVSVAWSCSDALSGLNGACPANSTVTGEGASLSASATIFDKAGNTKNTTVGGINIDRTAPNTTITAPGTWNNTDVAVTLTPADPLSGVANTYYILDGGFTQTGTALTVSGEGIHTIDYWSVDNVGNVEATHNAVVKIDLTDPTITHNQAPVANGNGWNNGSVLVTFICGDALSGIASCGPNQTATSEGAPQAVNGTAVDNAGNTASDAATLSIDLTAPTIDAAPDRAPNANNWYNADVQVGFTCGDALSGIATCPVTQTLGEGPAQTAGGTATDAADNSAYDEVSGINIDKTAPSLSPSILTAESTPGWYNTPVDAAWNCSDALSGIDGSCPANSQITGEGMGLGGGASVADKAGNITNASVSGLNIDRTPPTLNYSLEAGGNPYTQGSWTNQDVTVSFTCTDGLSGVAGFTTPQTLTGEGAAQSVPGSCTDNAGNVTTLSVENINIDKTAPGIAFSNRTTPNPNGWNNTAVTVEWSCSDALSGPVSPTVSTVVATEGANQSADGTCSDYAGNTAGDTQVNIDIDLTVPALSPSVSPNPVLRNQPANASANASDALSGIDTQLCGLVDTSAAGSFSVSCSATDLAGNFASVNASYAVATCAAGSYFDDQTSSCLPADPGYYVPADDMDMQLACDAGFYTDASGSVSCTPAPLGFFVFAPASSSATACPVGKYAPNTGMVSCLDAPLGSYVDTPGADQATLCAPGSYSDVTGAAACNLAPAGSFVADPGATSAQLCPAGKYSDVAGSLSCSLSPVGYFVPTAGSTSATACPVGYFGPAMGLVSCVPAPTGYFVPNTGAFSPILCAPGSYSDTLASAACTLAPAGSFVPVPGASSAQLCPAGTFSAVAGALACTNAPAGSFVDSPGATASTACPVGYFSSVAGSSSCDPAQPGQYVPNPGMTAPLFCAAGTFTSLQGSASCTPAPVGYFVPSIGAWNAYACPVGKYSPTTGAVSCLLADPGYFVGGIASISQSACVVGYFAPFSGMSSCLAATPGHFVDVTASMAELACAPGTYQPLAGQSSCLPADPGYYVPAAGEVAQTVCPVNYTSNAGATSCFPIDNTPPTASPTQSPAANGAGWNNTNVTVTWNWTDNPGGLGVDPASCTTSSTSSGEGTLTLNATCKDLGGNEGSASYVVKVDKTAPSLSPAVSPNPVILGGAATASANATDSLSGIDTQSCGPLNTGSVGVKTVTCSATDLAGNTASAMTTYSVIYNFLGFFQPVDNLPTINQVTAGRSIPVKFSLSGYQGMNIFAVGYPASQLVTCSGGAPIDDIETTVTAGSSSLNYDATTGQYNYVWKTDKAWTGTCRQLIVKLADGSTKTALFKFK